MRAGKHRTWMKMHLAANETSQKIQAVTLTTNAVDDAAITFTGGRTEQKKQEHYH